MTNLNPIALAVEPLRKDAIDSAVGQAQEIINKITKLMEEHNNNIHLFAPYPKYNESRETNTKKRNYHDLVCSLTEYDDSFYQNRRIDSTEHFRKISPKCEQRFIKSMIDMAEAQYTLFINKLTKKIGPVKHAELVGNHVWSYSFLTVTKEDGTQEVWKTEQIVNCSKLGKYFNQWPSRKVKK